MLDHKKKSRRHAVIEVDWTRDRNLKI